MTGVIVGRHPSSVSDSDSHGGLTGGGVVVAGSAGRVGAARLLLVSYRTRSPIVVLDAHSVGFTRIVGLPRSRGRRGFGAAVSRFRVSDRRTLRRGFAGCPVGCPFNGALLAVTLGGDLSSRGAAPVEGCPAGPGRMLRNGVVFTGETKTGGVSEIHVG